MCVFLLRENKLVLETATLVFSWQESKYYFKSTLKKEKTKRRQRMPDKKFVRISVFAKTFLGHFYLENDMKRSIVFKSLKLKIYLII